MEEDLDEIVGNIRACVLSNKGPTPIRSLARDYDTVSGGQIPFRRFNFTNLEDFLRSLPTLRVHGTGGNATVEAANISASSHVTALISKQKTSTKKYAAAPPRRSYPSASSYRGRGGFRGRGRGSTFSRPYAPRDYPSRDQPLREYNGYPARDQPSRDYNIYEPARDYNNHPPKDETSGGDYNHNNVPKRYSPIQPKRQENQPGGPLTVKVEGDDKRQVSFKRNEAPRFQRLRQQKEANAQQSVVIPSTSPVSPDTQSQMRVEIHCLGSTFANNLVASSRTDTFISSHLNISQFFYVPGARTKDVELAVVRHKPIFNSKTPLLIFLGETDVLSTTEKTKQIIKDYISLIFYLRELFPGIKLILVHLPVCLCLFKYQNHLDRVRSFNDFLSSGLKNPSNDLFVFDYHKHLDKFEYFTCGDKNKDLTQVSCHVNEKGFSTMLQFLIAQLQQGFDSNLFLEDNNSPTKSASIISAYKPSQLVERARKQQFGESSNFLGQPSSQGADGTNDLAAEFARLSHQNSNSMSLGNHRPMLNGQSQIPEDLGAISLSPLDCSLPDTALPEPDDKVLPNNVTILQRFCLSRGWPQPSYSVRHHKDPDCGYKVVYFASVKVNGDGANNFKVSSMPFEHENVNVVKGFAAKKALEKILEEESKKVKADKVISSDPNIICRRISDIVANAPNGLFANSVEDMYIERHGELLPSDWLQRVSSCATLAVESTVNNTIIVPKLPPPPTLEMGILRLSEPNFTVPPPLLDVEGISDEQGFAEVHVTNATGVDNVWFRVIGTEYSDAYDELLQQIGTYYKGIGAKDQVVLPEVGQYYAAQDNEFDTWFRVCVMEVDEDSRTVLAQFVDIGDTARFPFSSLYKLAFQFCQLPRQAVVCALEGLESFNDDELANEVVTNSDLLIGKSLIAKILDKTVLQDREVVFVKAILYDTSDEDDVIVNDLLFDEIISKAKPVLPAEGSVVEVSIGDVSKKGEVYVMFNGQALDRIADILEALGPEKISEHKVTSFKQISLNRMYLAKYSKDDTWYRAIVTTTPSVQHNKIPVRFVDYGNTESVSISDIADLESLPPVLRKLPAQAVKVALHNLPIESLSNADIASLHAFLLDEDKVVLLKTVSLKSDPPIVEIYTKDSEKTNLVSVNMTIQMQQTQGRINQPRNEENPLLSNQDGNLKRQDGFALQIPDFSDSKFQAVLVVLAAHPGNFIFQPVKYKKELKKLRGQMLAYYEAGALPELPAERIVKNKLFAARYHDDWYRAVVTDSPMGSRVPVRLCDFGDVTCVSIANLRELAPEFLNYPFMAVKGKLAGVVPIHKDWSVEDCIRFQNLVVDQILAGMVVHIQPNNENPMDMVVTLSLIDTSSEEDKDIAEILICENRAVRDV